LTLLDICSERVARRGPRTIHRPLAIVDPALNLPQAVLDLTELRGHPINVLHGRSATESAWRTLAADADPCQYSGHGVYDWADPLSSRLGLNDGPLTLARIFDEAFPVNQGGEIRLAGCETSTVDPRDAADEYLGIASGFLFAGAGDVLSSLWKVDSVATALLLQQYNNGRWKGLRPSAALRSAQIWLRDAGSQEVRDLVRDTTERLRSAGLLTSPRAMMLRNLERGARHRFRGHPFREPATWAAYIMTSGVLTASASAANQTR
jgi:CHAT domain-containing protein